MAARVKSAWICAARNAVAWGLLPIYLAFATTDVFADEPIFGVDAGFGKSDNIFRTSTDPHSTTIEAVGALFSVSELTNRFQGNLEGNLEYQHYSDNYLPARVIGTVVAAGKVALIPERFEWKFSENFGQTAKSQVDATTPGNLENLTYLTTGPLFTLNLGASNRVALEGTYTMVDYQYSHLDNQRYRGAVSINHDLSTLSSVSLNIFSERISYQDALLNPPIDQREAFARYSTTGARTRLALDVGYVTVKRQDMATNSQPVFHLDVSRSTSQNSTLNLSLGREVSDAGSLYKSVQDRAFQVSGAPNNAVLAVQPTSEPFLNTFETVAWKLSERHSTFSLSVSRYKHSYQTLSQFDQSSTMIRGEFDHPLTPTLELYSDVYLSKNSNTREFGDTTDHNLVLGLTKRVGRLLSLDFQYDRLDRTAAQAMNAGKENQLWMRIYYGSSVLGGGPMAPRSQ